MLSRVSLNSDSIKQHSSGCRFYLLPWHYWIQTMGELSQHWWNDVDVNSMLSG